MGFNNTNLNLYKSFIVAYETKNLHRAAEVLCITREAVRKNIKELGNQLGVTLFDSHSKGIEPTAGAKSIYPSIKSAIQSINETEIKIGALYNASTTIKIAVQSSIAMFYISEYMKSFYLKYPNIQFEFTNPENAELVINDEQAFKNTKFKTIKLFKVTAAFAASKTFLENHSLSETISKEELLNFPIIARKEAWQHFDLPAKVTKTTSAETTLKMTKDSIGIGIFSKEFLDTIQDNNLTVLNIKDLTMPTAEIVCGYIGTLRKPAKVFIDGLIKFLQN